MGGRTPPVIETDRLRLRAFREADFDAWVDIMQKPEVHEHLGPTKTRQDLWLRTNNAVGQWYVLGYGGLMVELRVTGRIIGTCSIFEAKRGLEFEGEPEVGYIFDDAYHGQGYGSEALGAMIEWAEANMKPTPLWAIIDPKNPASHALAAKFGFEKVSEDDYEGDKLDIMRRPAW
ncbi:GNAT family N-acetyltransferase [Sphingomicrobium sediminis]|uniref:GNAT family N-acetyltransferase n=1 Tax=Sphingomicrobium sediminis TaxID=2950949 RepID=A0A9X2J0Z8_9SPHN|nr:GNAT family N-acetyltransferase [Sphingomicrobium sediminis]MCM8556763.1 GNAT family N-acetyltransferase [Sphingomicrobium sediminis]